MRSRTADPLGICIVFQSSPHCNTADKGKFQQIIVYLWPVRPLSGPLPVADARPNAVECASSCGLAQNNNIDFAIAESTCMAVLANPGKLRALP